MKKYLVEQNIKKPVEPEYHAALDVTFNSIYKEIFSVTQYISRIQPFLGEMFLVAKNSTSKCHFCNSGVRETNYLMTGALLKIIFLFYLGEIIKQNPMNIVE